MFSDLRRVADNAAIDDELGGCIERFERIGTHGHGVLQDRVLRPRRFALKHGILL